MCMKTRCSDSIGAPRGFTRAVAKVAMAMHSLRFAPCLYLDTFSNAPLRSTATTEYDSRVSPRRENGGTAQWAEGSSMIRGNLLP